MVQNHKQANYTRQPTNGDVPGKAISEQKLEVEDRCFLSVEAQSWHAASAS